MKALATSLAEDLQSQGFNAELHSMDRFRPTALRQLKNVAFVISTHGEGDPPDEALSLFEYLESERAPRLTDLNYRVLALGDSSYQRKRPDSIGQYRCLRQIAGRSRVCGRPGFCKAGR